MSASRKRRQRIGGGLAGFALAALVIAGVACGPAPVAPAPRPTPTPAWTAPIALPASSPLEITEDAEAAKRIDADIRYLASPELAGRGTGAPGAKLAADYVARRFAELELFPFGDTGESGRGYLQKFQARVGARVAPPLLAIEIGGKRAETAADAMVTANGSSSGMASAEAVFVGYGISAPAIGWDDYASADVAGKIVIVLDGAPRLPAQKDRPTEALRDFNAARYKLRTAREHKAAAVILVAAGEEIPAAPNDASNMGVLGVVVKASAAKALLARAGVDAARARAAQTAGKAAPIPRTKIEVSTQIAAIYAEAWNVVGMLPSTEGSKRADEWVVVGAHYDHLGLGDSAHSRAPNSREMHPGADDNASGTALLLEVARRFTGLPRRPERGTLFVAFGAEEIGTIGSRHFVDHAPVKAASISAMINADMVGRMKGKHLLVDGVGTAAGWRPLVEKASAGLGLELTFGAEGFGASDHASFAAARVPVAFLFTGAHDDYHLPSDTADKINLGGVERASLLAARLALAVSEEDARLAFVDAPADPHRGMRGGFKVSLGTIPDYAFQGKGMRLTGVRPDAPAARAGITAGDVIIKVGAHEVTNVHDFMYALGELEPAREVAVEIDRAGKRIVLKVIPAPGR